MVHDQGRGPGELCEFRRGAGLVVGAVCKGFLEELGQRHKTYETEGVLGKITTSPVPKQGPLASEELWDI